MIIGIAAEPRFGYTGGVEPRTRSVSARDGGQRSQRGRVLQARAPRAGQRLPLQPVAGRPGRLHSLLPSLRAPAGWTVPNPRRPAGGSILCPGNLRHNKTHRWVEGGGREQLESVRVCESVGEHTGNLREFVRLLVSTLGICESL